MLTASLPILLEFEMTTLSCSSPVSFKQTPSSRKKNFLTKGTNILLPSSSRHFDTLPITNIEKTIAHKLENHIQHCTNVDISNIFRVNLHSVFAWMSRDLLLETGAMFENYCNGNRTHNHLVRKRTLKPFSQTYQFG